MEMVTCPNCKRSFPLDEAIKAEILKNFQDQMQREIIEKDTKIKEMEIKIKDKEKEVEERAKEIANNRIKSLENEVRQKIKEEMDSELEAYKKGLDKYKKEYSEIKEREVKEKMEYESRIFELENRNKEKDLEYQRMLISEINKIKEEQEIKVKDEFSIKEKEYLEQIESLKRKIEDLNRGLSSESNQLVGEAQEIAIEDKLNYHFPDDKIEPVPKGVEGGDIIQSVILNNEVAGKIIWESKRTKQWKDDWIDKLKEDKLKSGCDMGVIITKTMPKDSKGITIRDGIIVAEYSYLIPVASLLRLNLINIKRVKISQSDRNNKESMIYEYIISNDFRNTVQSLVDSIMYAKEDLEKEKMTLNRIWAKRNMDLERAVISLARIYGTMQGLVGNSLPNIPSLEQGDVGINQKQLSEE